MLQNIIIIIIITIISFFLYTLLLCSAIEIWKIEKQTKTKIEKKSDKNTHKNRLHACGNGLDTVALEL